MLLAIGAIVLGIALLVWSADKFVDGASASAKIFGMPPLLIGMVVVGFGTSAPEIVVSILAALSGNSGIALGNAYGSNIGNIALILGVTAMLTPIPVASKILKQEIPILTAVTALAIYHAFDGIVTRLEAFSLIAVFTLFMVWSIRQGLKSPKDPVIESQTENEEEIPTMSLSKAILTLIFGLVLMVVSSRILVYGAVELAHLFGISDLIIGLTIVAIGTSLPELASSIIAARKNQHDLAIGNIIGSNLFNTLAVVGVAGLISPLSVEHDMLYRDLPVMAVATLLLFVVGFSRRGSGTISRIEGSALVAVYVGYVAYLIYSVSNIVK